MAKKRSNPEDVILKLREADVLLGQRNTLARAASQLARIPTPSTRNNGRETTSGDHTHRCVN